LANVSKAKLTDLIAKKNKVDARSKHVLKLKKLKISPNILISDIVLFGFKTAFGGGRSTGFCLIYDAQ
jgi:hypothetical protein